MSDPTAVETSAAPWSPETVPPGVPEKVAAYRAVTGSTWDVELLLDILLDGANDADSIAAAVAEASAMSPASAAAHVVARRLTHGWSELLDAFPQHKPLWLKHLADGNRPAVSPQPAVTSDPIGEYRPPEGDPALWDAVRGKDGEEVGEKPSVLGFVVGVSREMPVITLPGEAHDRLHAYDTATGVYRPDGASRIRAWVERQHRLHGTVANSRFVNEVVGAVARRTHRPVDVFQHPGLVNVANGVLNLATRELDHHSPDVPFLYVLPVSYDPEATCPKFNSFGKTNVNDDKVWAFLAEWFGYTFYEGNDLKHATVLYGHTNTGRTTLLRIVQGVLGAEACAAISLYELARHRYALGALRGKLANICDDMSRETVPDLSLFKRITGSSPVQVEAKYQDPYWAVLGVKLTFTCNELPELKDADDAVWGRWFAIEFKVQISEKDQVPRLWEDIVREEGPGVLNWMLKGYDDLRKRKRFEKIATVEEVKKRWVLVSDSFTAWATDNVKADPKGWTAKATLLQAYDAWCEEQTVPAVDYPTIGKRIARLFPVVSTKRKGDQGWAGISLSVGSGADQPPRQPTLDGIPGGAGGAGGGIPSSRSDVFSGGEGKEVPGTPSSPSSPSREPLAAATDPTPPAPLPSPPRKFPEGEIARVVDLVTDYLQKTEEPTSDWAAVKARVAELGCDPVLVGVAMSQMAGNGHLVSHPDGRFRLRG